MTSYRLSSTLAALLCIAAIGTDVKPGMSQTPTQGTQIVSTNTQAGTIASTSSISQDSIESAQAIGRLTAKSIVKVYNYQVQGKPATTLYVRNLPVITLFGNEATSQPAEAYAAQPVNNTAATQKFTQSNSTAALSRAEVIAARLDQLQREGVTGDRVKVVWQGDKVTGKGQYVVKAGQRSIATIDQNTTYAETTSDAEQDALLVANRLRRLLSDGEVSPLKTVEGKPSSLAMRQPFQATGAWSVVRTYHGQASWYGPGFHGARTASGERFNQHDLTAAHPSLAFGTKIRVTNQYTGRSVIVRVNDRGPYAGGRIIDLSAGAADAIGLKSSGVASVSLEVLR